MKKYLTTAIPYMNGNPHIGHAMDYCLADVCARYWRLRGDEVRLQAGADEHGIKPWQKAHELNVPVQEYVDANVAKFQAFIRDLGVEYTDYVRTTDPEHERRCQEIWRRLRDGGHIYKDRYEGWYCSGCERFITEKEYEENHGVCPEHQKSYERLEEENYYFKIADFKERIRAAIESDEMQILPEFRKREVLRLLDESPDVSISRPRAHLEWGVAVPEDAEHVMYVWIDALANYITVLGYPDADKMAEFGEWWPAAAQFVGKDILRFHAIIWPAMLMELDLPLPRVLMSHGFILADGQKMSKSIGNVVDPMEVLQAHGVDAFRYYFLRHVDSFSDGDFTWEKFNEAYEKELANDLGNLVQRLATLAYKNGLVLGEVTLGDLPAEYCERMEKFEFSRAFDYAWEKVQLINREIDEQKPWMLAKSGETEKLHECLRGLIVELLQANQMLTPFLPQACGRIVEIMTDPIAPPEVPLFPKA